MSAAAGRSVAGWLAYWRLWQRYHRYTVEGLEHLDGGHAALIVGYHGRPLAVDMCMLTVALHDRLGYLPHGIVHRGVRAFPAVERFTRELGFFTEDGPELAAAIARGEHIVVTPGGGQEGCRSFWHRYEVSWGERVGYVRLALKHRLPIVPVGTAGVDDRYIGINDAETTGRRLGVPSMWSWTLWLGIGPFGVYPFTPPFPVRLRQLVGAPIDPLAEGEVPPDDREALLRVHRRVVRAVQALLDQARMRPYTCWR
jgi:hypothetical protein